MRLKFSTILSALILLISIRSMQADLSFSLSPAIQSGTGTNEVFFTGVLTNTSPTDNLFLNQIQFAFTGAATNYLMADTNVFFQNVPGILLPGETYTDVIFGIAINPAASPGEYSGTVTILGGSDIFATGNLTNQTFQISLPPATLVAAMAGTNLVIFWPSPPGGFMLQQNSDLTTTNWLAVTNTLAITNCNNQVLLLPSGGNRFFRLKYP